MVPDLDDEAIFDVINNIDFNFATLWLAKLLLLRKAVGPPA